MLAGLRLGSLRCPSGFSMGRFRTLGFLASNSFLGLFGNGLSGLLCFFSDRFGRVFSFLAGGFKAVFDGLTRLFRSVLDLLECTFLPENSER